MGYNRDSVLLYRVSLKENVHFEVDPDTVAVPHQKEEVFPHKY